MLAVDPMTALLKYLTAMVRLREDQTRTVPSGWRYACVEDMLLKLGRNWTLAFKPVTIRWGVPKSCFRNAVNLCLDRPDLTYVEGYAAGPIPIHHAWCVDREGRVIDATWKEVGDAYFGVPFKTEYVSSMAVKSRLYGVLWNYKGGWSYMIDQPEQFTSEQWR